MDNFEMASLPATSDAEIRRLLHFIVVGGGPTGVESAAEFSDFIAEDMAKYFPEIIPKVRLTIVEMGERLLPMFEKETSDYAASTFMQKSNINVLLQHAVTNISESHVTVVNKTPGAHAAPLEFPYGLVLWASGLGQVALAQKLLEHIPAQAGNRVLAVDDRFRVAGTRGVYAVGDCAALTPKKLEDVAEQIYNEFGPSGFDVERFLRQTSSLQREFPQLGPLKFDKKKFRKEHKESKIDLAAFKEICRSIDIAYRPPAPTAQNARKSGQYLAAVFNEFFPADAKKTAAPPFKETWDGCLAYVGCNQAVGNLPAMNFHGGWWSLPLWKLVYVQMQTSWRSRTICMFDWLRTRFAGRDVGRDHSFYK
eukprot:GHVT01037858.1.p1 GENE.GHVT01037858.1~~GHVT01037858.1.p1  ORF type:complete len:366 (-),score=90.22 GHVT01037858.1:486-1583(-)